MKIHLLDMGTAIYGDSILVTHQDKSILIDGGHPQDAESITEQLTQLLESGPPFAIDLLVVTHCHADHTGCLPVLVGNGDLTAKHALVADENLGWGRLPDGSDVTDTPDFTDAQRALVASSLEEDYSSLKPDEFQRFLADALKHRPRYIGMLSKLEEQVGTAKIVRYGRGRNWAAKVRQIEAAYGIFGLKVLGPTPDHLVKCAHVLTGRADAAASLVAADQSLANRSLADSADSTGLFDAYKRILQGAASADPGLADRRGPGAALNDQSIVLKVSADGWSALLAGDMQFAKPEVTGLDEMMTALRQTVKDNGPYDFIKLTHHTSYNGLDAGLLEEWSDTKLFAHSGGSNDPGHPDRGALQLLKEHSSELTFARTDRNGIITVAKNGMVAMSKSTGRLNDFSVNRGRDPVVPASEEEVRSALETETTRQMSHVVHRDDVVEVIARIPNESTRVTLTIDIDPEKKK